MNFKINTLDTQNIACVKTSGILSGFGYLAMAKELLQYQKWMPNNNVLFDHRELTFDNLSFVDIESIRKFHKDNEDQIGSGKSAIVVRHGMGISWKKLWEKGEKIQTNNIVKVFEDFDTAVHWVATP